MWIQSDKQSDYTITVDFKINAEIISFVFRQLFDFKQKSNGHLINFDTILDSLDNLYASQIAKYEFFYIEDDDLTEEQRKDIEFLLAEHEKFYHLLREELSKNDKKNNEQGMDADFDGNFADLTADD